MTAAGSGLVARASVACLVAGVGLLNVADARWAHAVGVICLLAFVLLGFRAIILNVLSTAATPSND
jgi:cytochrome d ubiquinol oxidase subunit II